LHWISSQNGKGKIRKNTHGRFSKGTKTTIYKAHELGASGRDVIKIPALAGGAGSKERIFFCHTCDDVFMGNKKDHVEHKIDEHPTQKPIELTTKLLKSCLPLSPNHLKPTVVYIPFAGSGSECLCCYQNNWDFYSSDITPIYVDWANRLISKYGTKTTEGKIKNLEDNGKWSGNFG
jgi:site-specific DNA-methyltransferase (adenine-specific)